MTRQQIHAFVESMQARGCTESSAKKYQRDLLAFYEYLPAGKQITRTTLKEWREALLAKGYAIRTVNACICEANGLLDWMDLREYQLPGQLCLEDDVQPELTRNEYLRLLSAAKVLGKERAYLLVKVFACIGLSLQELSRLTVEAVRQSRLVVTVNGVRQIVQLPAALRDDLTGYIQRNGLSGGPVFVSRNGKVLNRTAVTATIQGLAREAQVPPEKCNPRCLRKLYHSTIDGIQANFTLLVEQAHERLLETEQLTTGWEGGE
ncbi:tyrosine-type recombinase/integrase [Agathobaculum sp.]|uniref:tyrosine-type recombinase/integrase n=1 Tax=Agathobaculum sp. TaxID=2048138 RepID=UPI0027B95193|nr:hypothetical protein [Agathobaculum sp.]